MAETALSVLKGFLTNKFRVLVRSWSDVIVIPERLLHLMHEETNQGQVVELPIILRALLIRLCQITPEAEV